MLSRKLLHGSYTQQSQQFRKTSVTSRLPRFPRPGSWFVPNAAWEGSHPSAVSQRAPTCPPQHHAAWASARSRHSLSDPLQPKLVSTCIDKTARDYQRHHPKQCRVKQPVFDFDQYSQLCKSTYLLICRKSTPRKI